VLSSSVALAAHLAQTSTTLAVCWRVIRTDGVEFGFTSHDQDLIISGLTYDALSGIQPSSKMLSVGLDPSSMQVAGCIISDKITEDDIRAGTWDHATVYLYLVNWTDLSQGVVLLQTGKLGEITTTMNDGAGQYSSELRGLADALNTPIGTVYSPGCRASIGDSECGVAMSSYTATGEVTSVVDDGNFDTDLASSTVRLTPTTTGAPDQNYFQGGILTWLTGPNAGRGMEVQVSEVDGTIQLFLPMASPVSPGDTFSVHAGCAKSRTMCRERFGNVINMRAHPDLPGTDKMVRFGGQ
jgi:uncharacterized phage protein (TIGR02218 family)